VCTCDLNTASWFVCGLINYSWILQYILIAKTKQGSEGTQESNGRVMKARDSQSQMGAPKKFRNLSSLKCLVMYFSWGQFYGLPMAKIPDKSCKFACDASLFYHLAPNTVTKFTQRSGGYIPHAFSTLFFLVFFRKLPASYPGANN
jgi:hypothetical protein